MLQISPSQFKRNASGQHPKRVTLVQGNPDRSAPKKTGSKWGLLRYPAIAVTSAIFWLLILVPDAGIAAFWLVAIPGLPLLLMVAPGLWRNICPIAFVNQIPRMLGFSLGRPLPEVLKNHAYLVGAVSLFALIFLRHPLTNHHALALAVMIGTLFVLAFLGGLIFEGKGGWCGTFCPMAPLERAYGMAPAFVVRNSYCDTCHGCQNNCYDQYTTKTVFKDLMEDDERYVGHRKFFIGALPGLIYWFFTYSDPAAIGYSQVFFGIAKSLLASYGLFHFVAYLFPLRLFHVAQAFTIAAILIFYWFGAPAVVNGIAKAFSLQLDPLIAPAIQIAAVSVASISLIKGLKLERAFREEAKGRDFLTGTEFPVVKELPLLDSMLDAGLPIKHRCRKGACGSDPVVIVEGHENVEPPDEVELRTLRRMGLEGKARLACMCRVTGPVVVDTRARAADLKKSAPGTRRPIEATPEMRSGKPFELQVKEIVQETPRIKRFKLCAPGGSELPPFEPGAHLPVSVRLPNGEEAQRHYSIMSDCRDRSCYEIGVLAEPEGRGGSRYLHEHVGVGDKLLAQVPKNDFPMDPSARHNILISGGIGITPIIAMTRSLQAQGGLFELHYCAKKRSDFAFWKLISSLAGQWATYYASKEQDGRSLDLEELLSEPIPGVHVYCCGPRRMIDAFREVTRARRWPTEQVHFETFGADASADDREVKVTLAKSGRTITVPPSRNILDAVLETGCSVPHDCKRGECSMCTTEVLAGDPDHRDVCLTEEEQASSMCLCVSRAKGDKLVLDL